MASTRGQWTDHSAGRDKLLGPHGVRRVALVAVVTGLVAGGASTALDGRRRSSRS